MEVLQRIKRLVVARKIEFTLKATEERIADALRSKTFSKLS